MLRVGAEQQRATEEWPPSSLPIAFFMAGLSIWGHSVGIRNRPGLQDRHQGDERSRPQGAEWPTYVARFVLPCGAPASFSEGGVSWEEGEPKVFITFSLSLLPHRTPAAETGHVGYSSLVP